MIRAARLALAALLLAAPAGAALAAGPAEPAEAAEPEDAPGPYDHLPRSLVPQGVIGRMSLPEGLPLLDADILELMRSRLETHMPVAAPE